MDGVPSPRPSYFAHIDGGIGLYHRALSPGTLENFGPRIDARARAPEGGVTKYLSSDSKYSGLKQLVFFNAVEDDLITARGFRFVERFVGQLNDPLGRSAQCGHSHAETDAHRHVRIT